MYEILIDDIRNVEGVDIIFRTAESARNFLIENDFKDEISVLYMDHDLGDLKDNGYKILSSILEKNIRPKKVTLVTSNPVGRDNMCSILSFYNYKSKNNLVWYF